MEQMDRKRADRIICEKMRNDWSIKEKSLKQTHKETSESMRQRQRERETLSLDKKGGGENVEQREPESQAR